MIIKYLYVSLLILFTFSAFAGMEQLGRTSVGVVQQLYQMMKDVHELFQVYQIPYWIDGGTLLGAVRHKGMIPWDDDLDICVEEKYIDQLCAIEFHLEELGYKLLPVYFGYKIFPINGEKLKFEFNYPFLDIFIMQRVGDRIYYRADEITNLKRDKDKFHIKVHEITPRAVYYFGPLQLFGINKPYPYLEIWYKKNWYTTAVITCDHKTSQPIPKIEVMLTDMDRKPALPFELLQDRVTKY